MTASTPGIRTPGIDRLQAAPAQPADEELDRSLRPRRLADFVGQHAVRDQLSIFIEAARARGEALDHVLLAGPPGLGKTSLAQIVAHELEAPFVETAGPALERKADIAAFLTALEPRSVFFVDELHRLPRAIEETFYPAMEDRRLPITVGQGGRAGGHPRPAALHARRRDHPGRAHSSTPLRDRFGVSHRLDLYGPDELATIVRRSARILEVQVDDEGARAIASRARGTPRVANRLLRRIRDFAEVRGEGGSTPRWPMTPSTCSRSTRPASTASIARSCARCAKSSPARPSGSTLAVAVAEEADTIEDVYEPYLLQQGFLQRTPRGRQATRAAFAHLGLERPHEAASLF